MRDEQPGKLVFKLSSFHTPVSGTLHAENSTNACKYLEDKLHTVRGMRKRFISPSPLPPIVCVERRLLSAVL
jgi:hypothetical protein